MIPPDRVLFDKASGRTYYIDSANNVYADKRFRRRVKCGLGHTMWSTGNYIVCSICEKNMNIKKIRCEVIPFKETEAKAKG